MKRIVTLIAGALALVAAPVAAEKTKPDIAEYKAIEAKNLVSGKQKIDPAKAYIFVRSPANRTNGVFLKTPSAGEIANFEAKWREEFEEEVKRYPRRLASWEAIQKSGRKGAEKPIEPTEENFAIAPIETRMIVPFGPQFVFEKTDGETKTYSYLVEVEPGEYTYLGPILYLPGTQTFGVCYCMGSVKFEAKAGQITSLGDFLSLGWADRAALEQSTFERTLLPDRPAVPTDWSVPEALAQYPHAKAELRAAGKRNNFLSALVGRIPPVPRVLGYDRDIPIDLVGLAEGKVEVEPAPAPATETTEAAAAETEAGMGGEGEPLATPDPARQGS
ncbi:MAG: hypothetical protein V2I74_14225 [Erythrobacter sp.]|jgi:hypothetical protein|nr:hypothetical protein [Erythrobacter sp.]